MNNECYRKKTAAVVLSGGKGTRMGGDIAKQYLNIGDKPIIYYSLKVFEESFVDEVILVCAEGDEDYCRSEIVLKYNLSKVRKIVHGGRERYHSVLNGLRAAEQCDIVFIHDGARPFITHDILKRAYDATCECGASVIAVPSKDTVKLADVEGYSKETPDRNTVWNVQTPQTFDYTLIKDAYEKMALSERNGNNLVITDDAMVMEQFGDGRVKLVMGDYKNIKITTPEDMIVANAYLQMQS